MLILIPLSAPVRRDDPQLLCSSMPGSRQLFRVPCLAARHPRPSHRIDCSTDGPRARSDAFLPTELFPGGRTSALEPALGIPNSQTDGEPQRSAQNKGPNPKDESRSTTKLAFSPLAAAQERYSLAVASPEAASTRAQTAAPPGHSTSNSIVRGRPADWTTWDRNPALRMAYLDAVALRA